MEKQELLNKIEGKLNENFSGAVEKTELAYDFPVFYINKDKIHEVLAYLKNEPEFSFHFLTDLCGIPWG